VLQHTVYSYQQYDFYRATLCTPYGGDKCKWGGLKMATFVELPLLFAVVFDGSSVVKPLQKVQWH